MASTRFVCSLRLVKYCRLFSQVTVSMPTFDEMPLEKHLVDQLRSCNIVKLTEIQKNSLQSVLNGENVIINSETGSGKTLCYLLPILNRLLQPVQRENGPTALILVPNMHLGFQITELFNNLSAPGFFACPVHQGTRLRINRDYPLIVSTPQSLLQYNLKCLSTLETIVVDEADLIVANGGKLLWKVLNSLQNFSQEKKEAAQFVFVAATLPHRGEKSVFRKITEWLPDVLHITSSMVHQHVATIQTIDVVMTEEDKLANLLRYLINIFNVGKDSLYTSNDNNVSGVLTERRMKVLVFVNTVSKAKDVLKFLDCDDKVTLGITAEKCAESSVVYPNDSDGGMIKSSAAKFYNSSFSWRGKVGVLHKGIVLPERVAVLEQFKRSEIDILVCTDLGSRGLDIAGVTHVIQLDYASNAADVLHRAGRTARAGAQGTVINFITEKDQDLVEAVEKSKKGPGAEGFQDIFSRNRMFGRRIKRNLK